MSLFVAGAVLGEVPVSLFVAGAILGEVELSLFVTGAVLGEVPVSLFVAGAVFGEVLVSLFVAGAVHGEVLVLLFVAGAVLKHVTRTNSIGTCSSELYIFSLLKLPPPPRAAILVYTFSVHFISIYDTTCSIFQKMGHHFVILFI